jgi:hypothetical protein
MNYPPQQAQPRYKPKLSAVKPRASDEPVSSYSTRALQTPAVQPVQDEKGWLRQQADDVWGIVSGIPNIIWHTAKAYKDLDYGAVLSGLMSDPDVVANAVKESLGSVLHGATEHYRDTRGEFTPTSVAMAPIKRPLLVGLDALTLMSLGGAAALKAAPLAGKIAGAGAEAKWINAGLALERLPRLAVESGLRAAGQLPIVKPLLEGAGWDATSLRANRLFHEARVQHTGKARELARPIVEQEIGKGLYDELIDVESGYKHLDPTVHPPETVGRMRELSKVVRQFEEEELKLNLRAASGDYTPEMLEGARLNHLRERMRSKGVPEEQLTDDLVRAHRDAVYSAADAAGTGEIQRDLFWHAMRDNAESFDDFIFGLMSPSLSQTSKKAGILERFMGRSKYILNPNLRHMRYIQTHLDLQGKIAGIRRIMQDPELARPMLRTEIPHDWREIPNFMSKNLDYHEEMRSLLMRDFANASTSEELAAAVRGAEPKAIEFSNKMAKDILEGANSDRVIAVPRQVARFLDMEMEPSGAFGRLYDRGMDIWRDLALTFMPRYYVNNLLGNSILMLLGGYRFGNLPGRKRLEAYAPLEMRSGNFFVESGLAEKVGAGSHMAKLRNALSDIQYHTENRPRVLMMLNRLSGDPRQARLLKSVDGIVDAVGLEGSKATGLEKLVEMELKAREFAIKLEGTMAAQAKLRDVSGLPGIAKHQLLAADIRSAVGRQQLSRQQLAAMEPLVAPAEDAVRYVEKILGPYGKITPLSRRYIRRVIPFWTFGSTMARLMFWLPILRPKTTWLYSAMSQMALDAWEDERLPDYLKGSVWWGTNPKTGMLYFSRLAGFNPFEMMSERKFGRVPIPALLDPTQGPIVGAAIKMVGGYDQFSHRPPPLDLGQVIDNAGRVWELDATGTPRRVSPQTPFLDALGEMIPQISVLNDVMAWSGLQVPGRGAKLYQMPDGTMFNPRHWQWGLANGIMRSLGSGVTAMDIDRAKAQQRSQTIRMIRHLGKQALRAAEPEERAQFMKLAKHAIDSLRGR